MTKQNNLEKGIEDFYSIYPYKKAVKLPGLEIPHQKIIITDYTLEEFDEEKINENPSKLIDIISSLSGENFDNSMLNYGKVRKSYEKYDKQNLMDIPIVGSWLATGGSILYSFMNPLVGIPLTIGSFYLNYKSFEKKMEKIQEHRKEFSEFKKLLKASKEADKIYKGGKIK